MKDLVSIIVPVYNAEGYLKQCIESIIHQTYKNLEIILIDDGSTDNSSKICDEYSKKDNRIKIIHKKNGGVSSARNIGINIAKGEYIGFVDSDDFVNENMYQILVKNIQDTGADISICSYTVFQKPVVDDKKTVAVLYGKKAFLEILDNENYAGFLFNKLYRVEILKKNDKIKQLNEQVYILEDLLFNTELVEDIHNICFIDQCLYYYRQRKDSALHKNFEPRQLTSISALLKLIEIYERNNYAYTNQKKINFIIDAQIKKSEMSFNNYNNKEFISKVNRKIKEFLKQNVLLKKATLKSKVKCIIALIKPNIFVKKKYKEREKNEKY